MLAKLGQGSREVREHPGRPDNLDCDYDYDYDNENDNENENGAEGRS